MERKLPNWHTDIPNSPVPGVVVYNNVLEKELNIIDRLEKILSKNQQYQWSEAMVGYRQKIPTYRDCVDFKFKKTDISLDQGKDSLELQDIWQNIYDRQAPLVKNYSELFSLGELRYWEAFNFIRYKEGQHFQYHHDHGYSYNCVVSLVQYLNDDYEGGELDFGNWGYTYKPVAGDLVVFPSNYIYSHRAMPVTKGTKYSIVTMLDYSDKFHNPKFYEETGS